MLVLGVVLIVVAVLVTLGAIFLSGGEAELFGLDLPPVAIFVVGVVAGAFLVGGVVLTKQGTKREWRVRKDRKQLRHYQEQQPGDGSGSAATKHRGGSPG